MTTDDTIWIGQNGEKYGPYTEAVIRQWLAEGKLAADAMAWRSGMAAWVPVTTLFPAAAMQQPPPPPVFTSGGNAAHGPGPTGFGPADTPDDARAAMPAPPSLHWGLVLLFTIFTLGIFAIIWPFIQAKWVRRIDTQSRASLLLGLAMGCSIIGYILYFAGVAAMATGGGAMVGLGGLLLLAYWVLYLVAYFSMAGSMRRQLASRELPLEIGGVTLFFFTMYYLQGQLSWLAHWKATGQTSPKASKGVFWALWAVPFVIAILAAISIPAYQEYLIRSQVSEGVVLADGAKTAIAEYYSSQGKMPADNAAAGLAESPSISGKYVSSVDVSGGRITVAFDTAAANSAIRDKVLILMPAADAGALTWSCTDSTVPDRDLPMSCRQ